MTDATSQIHEDILFGLNSACCLLVCGSTDVWKFDQQPQSSRFWSSQQIYENLRNHSATQKNKFIYTLYHFSSSVVCVHTFVFHSGPNDAPLAGCHVSMTTDRGKRHVVLRFDLTPEG